MHNALALIVPADTDLAIAKPFTVGDSYQMLSEGVGGYIECVHVRQGIDMWCNEDGISLNLPMNAFATMMYWAAFPQTVLQAFIYGDVVFTSTDGMGETTSLTVGQFEYLGKMLDDFEIKIDLNLLVS
jgi:hypothetical protein